MSNLFIKICGIKDLHIAEETAKLGADFIGLVFYPNSKRHVDIKLAKQLSDVIKQNGAIPVAVFVDQSAAEMQEICLTANIETVQLHGDMARQQHYLLPENYTRIYVISLNPRRHRYARNDAKVGNGLIHCNPERDFLLFDHIDAGKGKSFNWTTFVAPKKFRWFLAGGLNPDNISSAIQQLKPTGVDVSSGVENQSGQKDIELIEQFIKEARR